MKSLNYNIYSHISDQDFLYIKDELIPIENEMGSILKGFNWKLHSPVAKSDALAVDFLKKDGIFRGNIGLLYDDEPGRITFTFAVTKSFDENRRRYFARKDIFKNRELNFFNSNINAYVMVALEIYDKWTKDDIIKLDTGD